MPTGRTVGVEEELLLLHPGTGAPLALAGTVLAGTDRLPSGQRDVVEAELQQQQIEIETSPTASLADLADQVQHGRRTAAGLAERAGARIAALATSPLPVTPTTTLSARYLRMVEHFGLTTTEQLTCGCHVHVGVDSDQEGVAVLDRIRVWLPVLLAVSANSPYWQGHDTGYASFRSQAWTRFPSAGPAEVFGSARAYAERVERLIGTGVVLDRAMIYFDARLSHRYPTVEIRIADVCLRAADTVLVAALARALVDTAVQGWRAGDAAPEVPADLVRLATWRAGRSGLAGELLDPYTTVPRPAADVLADLRRHLAGALTSADAALVDAGLDRVLRRGTGADTQRQAYGRRHRLTDVALAGLELTGGDDS